MLLYRNDLQKGFEKKNISIPKESLEKSNFKFIQPEINCVLTCKSDYSGFKLNGILNYQLSIICDRCMSVFESKMDVPFKLILSSQNNIIDEKENFMLFTDEADEIDILPFINESIQLSLPMKILCEEACKGLCSQCGTNLNLEICKCISDEKYTPFDRLNQLLSN